MSGNSIPIKGQSRTLPVLLRNQAVYQDLRLAIFADKAATIVNSNAPANAFVIEVEDGRFGLQFPIGTQLVVVRTSKPRHGCLVAVYRHQTGMIVLCRYSKVGDITLLYNTSNNFILPADSEDIIGEVIEANYNFEKLEVK